MYRHGRAREWGRPPGSPSIVVVPVAEITPLVEHCLAAARSMGHRAVAVHVALDDPPTDTASLQRRWRAWKPEVPLVTLHSGGRQVGPPLADYVRRLESRHPIVLIGEVDPDHWWEHPLSSRRGDRIARCLLRTTDATVCRIPFTLAAHGTGPRDHQERKH